MPSGSTPSIPNDVWLSVAEFATKDALCNLCLVSKNLYLLLQTHLFSNHFECCSTTAIPALRSCLARPDLAAAVKKMKVWDDNDRLAPSGNSEWHSTYDAQIQNLQEDGWPTGSEFPRWSKDIVLLWSMVPNLQHLVLEISPTDSTLGDALGFAQEHWTSSTPLLSQLSHLQLDWPFDEDGIDLPRIRHFLLLPSLKVLQAHHCNFEDGEPILANERGQLSIEHIDLRCSVATDRRIQELLEACRCVKTFQINYAEVTTGAVSQFDFGRLRDALEKHKSSLESLVVDFEGDTATELLEEDELWGVFNVSRLDRLRHIDMPWWSVFPNAHIEGVPEMINGWEMLPRSIESLVLRGCDSSIWPTMYKIVSPIDEFSNLKHVTIQGSIEYEDEEHMSEIAQDCWRQGIGFNEKRFLKRNDHSDLTLRYFHQCLEEGQEDSGLYDWEQLREDM